MRHTLSPRQALRGFTLVELMITMVVSGVVIGAAYQIFATTSESMLEVENLSEVNERARFAVELIGRDIQSAAAFGSPDTGAEDGTTPVFDIWTAENHRTNQQYRVRGILQLPLRQDQQYGTQATQRDAGFNQMSAAAVSSDEIIVLGAYDYPVNFEVSQLAPAFPGPVQTALVRPTSRGTMRLMRRDAFEVAPRLALELPENVTAGLLGPGNAAITRRLLRIMDRNGYQQFATIANAASDAQGLLFTFGAIQPMYRQGAMRDGLEPSSEQDIGYEAALIDAYRYRVCIDPRDGRNLKLIREPIDAGLTITQAGINGLGTTNVNTAEVTCGQPGNFGESTGQDQVVLADHVADFQVWFDCQPAPLQPLVNQPWARGWTPPDESIVGNGNDCMLTNGAEVPMLARVAHVRLSVHTKTERRDVTNYGFLNATLDGTTNDPLNASGGLQTFDTDGNVNTASRVKTFQIDLELPNFALRN